MKKGGIVLLGFFLASFLVSGWNGAETIDRTGAGTQYKKDKEDGAPFFVPQELGVFRPCIVRHTGSEPGAVAIGDVSGDGRNDVVLTTADDNDPMNDYKLFVFRQNTSGELGTPVKYEAGDGESVAIGDLNDDGRDDVVVSAADKIAVFLQNGTGGLNPAAYYNATNDPRCVRVADLNNDGLLDVVSTAGGYEANRHQVNVFLQNGGGALDPPDIYTAIHQEDHDLEVGDINDDGLTDIVVLSGSGSSVVEVAILYQNPGGTFNPAVYYDLGDYSSIGGEAIGDVNGDGRGDLVVTYGDSQPDSFVGVFYQNANGALNNLVSYDSFDYPSATVTADINGDLKLDAVVVHRYRGSIGVYTQKSDGTLQTEELYHTPDLHENPYALAAGDINGDGKNDVVMACPYDGLAILYHKCPSVIADFGAVGLWNWSRETWEQISGVNADGATPVRIDLDADVEYAVDFGSLGIWLWDSGDWEKISGFDAEQMITADIDDNGDEEIIADCGLQGLWLYEYDVWSQISAVDAEEMVPFNPYGSGEKGIVADFGSLGIWRWSSGTWAQLSGVDPEGMIVASINDPQRDNLFVDFGALGVWMWEYSNWSQVTGRDPESMIAADTDGNGLDEVLLDLGSLGLRSWDGAIWSVISSQDPEWLLAADVDRNGDDEIVAGWVSAGVWMWNDDAWGQMTGLFAEQAMAADTDGNGGDELVAVFGILGLWQWKDGDWSQLSTYAPESMVSE
jgi:hypothetical protein